MSKQFNRQRRHNTNRSNRSIAVQQITRYTNLDSSGPLGKLRGTPLQLAEKYQAGAKDALTQGDDVLFQTCQQYADHYLRLQAIAIENEQARSKTEEPSVSETSVEDEDSGAEPENFSPYFQRIDRLCADTISDREPFESGDEAVDRYGHAPLQNSPSVRI